EQIHATLALFQTNVARVAGNDSDFADFDHWYFHLGWKIAIAETTGCFLEIKVLF
ncbi:hypothetical protein U1Q18_025427, partial [Sarracenia purpurea var. burkii]